MIPLTVDVPMKRLPWANWGLILATVLAGEGPLEREAPRRSRRRKSKRRSSRIEKEGDEGANPFKL
jgi:hypothetical protein